MIRTILDFLSLVAGLLISTHANAAPPRIAILGDSITYGGRWATLVESALRDTPRFSDAVIVNFGLPSETVSGLSEDGHAGGKFPRPCLHERLERILVEFTPTLVLACYGMNDGIYLPQDEIRFKAYQDGILKLKIAVEARGARVVFITAPLHNADKPSDDPNRYDAVLDGQARWLLARSADGWQVIDIRPDLKLAVAENKRNQPEFTFAGDGVHPGSEGHRFIAESICTQLWPIWKLEGKPRYAVGDALAILAKRNELLKHAWLTQTRHTRPGIPDGIPLNQAGTEAAELLGKYREATAR
jgi:lysophospholipase L1-like esterase